MSLAARSLTQPIVAVGGLAYFSFLIVLLVLNHISPLIVLAMTLGAITLVVIALRPYFGLHAFIVLLFVENAFAFREGVTALRMIGMIIFCGWLLSTVVTRRRALRLDRLTMSILVFLVWSVVTLVYAIDPELGVVRSFTYAQLAAASLMFGSVIDDPVRLRGIFRALVIWSLVATCVAISGYYLGITPFAVGISGNRNLLATYINVGVVCAFLLYQSSGHRIARLWLLFSLPVLFLGLAVTFSRTGLIVLGMSLLFVWYRIARQHSFGVLVGSVLSLCLIALLLPVDFYQRAGSIIPVITRQEDTFGTRVRLWKAGIRMIESRPVLGVGPGNFGAAVSRYSRGEIALSGLSAHNTYVSVGAEMGLVGLTLFVLVLVAALRGVRRAIRRSRDPGFGDLGLLGVMGEISLFVVLGAGLTSSVEHHKLLWLLIGTCAALGRMAPQRAESSPSAAEVRQELEMGLTEVHVR